MKPTAKRLTHWEIPGLWAGAVLALGLGYAGLSLYYYGQNRYSSLDLLYMSFQLFTLQFTPDPGRPANAVLELARFLAPALASYAALRALMALFAEPLHSARLSRLRNHAIVCGMGRKGFALVKDYRTRHLPVVVVEWDKENDLLETCRDLGALVVLGDAAEAVILVKAGIRRARQLYAVCDEDGVNAEIGMAARSLRTSNALGMLDVYLHVEDFRLCALLRWHGVHDCDGRAARLHLFNAYENAARHVLRAYPLDGTGLAPADPRSAHLAIIGFGKMGETLALHAAQLGHFANGRKLRLTLVDRQLAARVNGMLGRHRFFREVCELETMPSDYEDKHVLDRLQALAADPHTLLTIVVCIAEEGRSLACGLRLLAELPVPAQHLLVRLERDSGLGLLARSCNPGGAETLHPFSVGGAYISEKEIAEKDRNKLAKAIHTDYSAGQPDSPSAKKWDELDEELRDSSRQAADHVPVKLRAIGRRVVDSEHSDAAFAFTDQHVEMLAELEHRRWMAAQKLNGYTLGPRDRVKKTHPAMVEWSALVEADREQNRHAVRRIPEWLRTIGKGVAVRTGKTD